MIKWLVKRNRIGQSSNAHVVVQI